MDFLDPDFQEGADTLPRLRSPHSSEAKQTRVSQLYDALSSQSDWLENKKKKTCACSDHARKVELLQLAFIFFHEVSRNIKMEEVRSMAFSY